MGTGSVYQERGKWVAQVSIGPRSQRRFVRRTRATRRDALAALAELRGLQTPLTHRISLGVYLTRWIADVRNLRPATRHAYANAIDYHLIPTIGEIRLSELNPIHVEHMLSTVGERVGPKTLRNVHAVLRRALAMAVRAGLVTRNVAAREFVDEWQLGGKKLFVLADGRLINLAAAEGHPASVMDMSFANQALAAEHVVRHGKSLAKDVHRIPADLDKEIARLKLEAMGVEIDTLTAAQRKYLASWDLGT